MLRCGVVFWWAIGGRVIENDDCYSGGGGDVFEIWLVLAVCETSFSIQHVRMQYGRGCDCRKRYGYLHV